MSEVEKPVDSARKVEPARVLDADKPKTGLPSRNGVGSRGVQIRRLQRGLGNAAFARLMTARQSAARPRLALSEHIVSNLSAQTALQEPAAEEPAYGTAVSLLRPVSAATEPPPPDQPDEFGDGATVVRVDGDGALPPDDPDEIADGSATPPDGSATGGAPPPDEAASHGLVAQAEAIGDLGDETADAPQGAHIARTPSNDAAQLDVGTHQGPGTLARQAPGGIPALRGPMPGGLTGIDKIREINKGGVLNWTGPLDENDLEEEWSKLGPSGAKQYEDDFMMSIKRGMEPDNLKGSEDAVESFKNAVTFLRDEYLRGNLKDIDKEEKKLGINEEKPSEANEAAMTELVVLAEKAKTLDEIIKKYGLIQVGYNEEMVQDEYLDLDAPGSSSHLEYRPAYFSPGSPPQKGLNGSEGQGAKPYEEVLANYSESMGALMAVANKHPSIYLALKSGQMDSIAGKDGAPAEDPKAAIKLIYSNARKAIQETQADPPDWDELKPIHSQLFRGEKTSGGISFKDPWYREIAKDEVGWSETKETLADIGIGLAAAIAFIFSEIATGGMATVLWAGAGLAIGGANVARKYDNYDQLKTAAAAGTSQATELIEKDQVNAALLDLVIEAAFFFIDAVGVGVKGIKGLAGLGVKKAGAQAAEKVGVAALKGVKSMGAIEAAETLTKGINELGVKRAAEAAGMSLDDLLSKVGEHTAAGARIREYMKLAKAGGVESAKLPAALKTVISGGEVLSETGAKLTAEQVAKQALEELGPQAALKAAGDWKTLANALGPTSEAAKGFTAWRKAVYGDLRNYIKSLAKEGETVDDLIKETGTLDNMTNDLDISLLGAKSSEHKEMAAQFLAGRTGLSPNPAALDKMVYIGLFTDPRRMHLFDEFPELQAKLAKRTMKFEEELIWNDEYAKYLAKGNKGDKAAAKLAEEIGQEMDALGVNKIPGFRPLSDRAAAVLSKNQDQLHEAILAAHKAGDMGKVESLIEELSNIQAQINVKEGGGYFSSGGVKKFVTEKEGFGGATRAAATAAQDLGAATDQVNKLRKAIQAFESAALVPPASRDISELAKHIKDLSKYGDRFAEAASVIGKPDGSALATMADEFSQILLQARGATVHTLQETLAKNMEGVIAKVRGVIKVYDDAHLEIIKALRERAAIDAVKDVAAPAIIDATRRRYAYLTFSSALIAQMDAAARAVGIPLQQLLGPEGEGGGGAPAAKPEEDEGPKGDFPITTTNNGSVATSRIDRQPAPPEPSRLSAAPLQGANGSQEPHTSLDRSRIHAPDSVEPPLQRVARIDGNVGGGIVARGVMGSVFGPIPMPWAKTGIDKIRDILSDWWVGPFAESDLEDEWSKLGPSGAKQYEKEFMQSIDRGMEPDNLKGSGEVVESFENAVAFLRDEYLRGNLRDIEKEEKKLGINEEKPSEANEAAMTELKLIAEKAKTLNEILKKYSEIQVGYKKLFTSSGDRGPGGGAVGEWEWYPAYFWPGSPPQKALSGTEGAGSKPYDEVMASYTESRGALMAVASQHPAVYLALKSGQLDSIAGKDGLEPEDPKSAIKVLYGNARKAIEETQADPPDWDELKPIHGQLLRGEKGFMGIPFKDPWYREIVKDEIDWSETKDTLADLGIGLAAAIAFIFSEIATGGAATVIWAGVGLGIGGANVARKWDNYNELKNAAAAGTSEATELVSQDQVNAAFLDAVIESAFSFIDVVGIGIKGVKGVAGMAVKKAGAEALEKAAGTAALRGLKSMGGEEAAEAAAKGIKELGVKRAADEAGMSVEDLLAKVGKESAVGQQIEAYLKLAKEGVEPAKLPGAVKAVVEGGEVVGQNGVKMSAEEVIKQAVDTLGFQRTLKEAGSWKDLASALGASSEVGKRFKGWRDGVFADLENFIKGLRQADDEATEELIQKTGTLDNMTNDLDISFLGKHASENKEAATKYLAARTGLGGDANTLDKMVYIGLFTDPRRMHFFDMEKFAGLQQQLVKKTLAVQEQLIWNDEYYQWLLKAADGKTGAKEMAEKIAAEMDALGVVKMKGYKPLSELTLPVLAKEQDRLHSAILAAADAGDLVKAESMIEELANIQAQINVKEGGGYFSSGGVRKFVTEKEGFPGARAATTAAHDLGAALDQVNKLRKAMSGFEAAAKAPAAGDVTELAKYIKDTAKYGDRFRDVAAVIGKAPDGSALSELSERFSALIKKARSEKAGETLKDVLVKDMEGIIAETRAAYKAFDDAHMAVLQALRERAAIEGMQDLAPDIVRATKILYGWRIAQNALIAQMDAAARSVGIFIQHGVIREEGTEVPPPREEDENPIGDFPIPSTSGGSIATSRIDRRVAVDQNLERRNASGERDLGRGVGRDPEGTSLPNGRTTGLNPRTAETVVGNPSHARLMRSSRLPSSEQPGDTGQNHSFQSLGNQRTSRLLASQHRSTPAIQRNWGSTELEAKDEATEWPARFQLMNGWSIEYMLETADELQKKRRLDKYIEQAAIPENVKGIFGDRIIATLKTSAARFDAEYYTCMAAVKPNDPEGFDILLKRAGKAVSAGRIDASVPQLAVRWFGRNEFEAAGALLDPMAMGQLLDALMTINAAGYRDHARNPLVHKNPARALRIQLAAVIADWAVKPVEWSSYEPTIRGIIASLDPADQSAIAAWVANKPELAHLADVGGDLAAQGQFAFGGFLHYELAALIASEGAGGELAIANALDSANIYDSDDFSTKMEKGARVARRSYAGLNPIFQFRAVSRDRGLAIYEELWAEYEKTRTLATMNRYRNLYDLHSLRIAEKDRCNAQVRHMHGLHSNLGGGAGTGPEPKLAGNGLVKDIKHHKVPATAVPWRGSEVTYVGNLDAIVASMKAVLDTNRRIIAGVLSGAQGSITPEHYLYIIGYRGNSFVCADSDPGNEQAGGLPVAGVTYLYYDPAANRLSTAPTDAEFPINYTPTEARFQMNGPHRYQALTVSVLPSKRAP